MTAATRMDGGRLRSGWRFVACLVLLAFTLQSYVTQSHIHDGLPGTARSAVLKTDAQAPGPHKSPLDDNPLNCSLCQALAHAGAFLAPADLLLLPAQSMERAVFQSTGRALSVSVPHDWQSRAPPQH